MKRDSLLKPLAIDLFAGLGGWAEGFLTEGYDVIGFDIERHRYWLPEEIIEVNGSKGTRPLEKRGWTQGCAVSMGLEGPHSRPRTRLMEYPGQLVLQDVLTLHGSQFKDAAVIVASPPCQEFSYMAMPWKRAKQIAAALRGQGEFPEGYKGSRTVEQLTALFDACFRIAREAAVPLVVENVKGAQPWVGRATWNYGSYYLWGDLPALMVSASAQKVPGFRFDHNGSFQSAPVNGHGVHLTSPMENGGGVKCGGSWFHEYRLGQGPRNHGSNSPARKAASAMIAKIPLPLAQHIARVFKPSIETVRHQG